VTAADLKPETLALARAVVAEVIRACSYAEFGSSGGSFHDWNLPATDDMIDRAIAKRLTPEMHRVLTEMQR
jgi:hypothetical protein